MAAVTTIPYSSQEIVNAEYDNIDPDAEVSNIIDQVTVLQRRLAPDGTLKEERHAMCWLIRQSLRWSIWKYQRRSEYLNSSYPKTMEETHRTLVVHRSLDVLMGVWNALGGTEEELSYD